MAVGHFVFSFPGNHGDLRIFAADKPFCPAACCCVAKVPKQAGLATETSMARPQRVRFRDAAGDDQPDLPGSRGDSTPLGPSIKSLSALLYYLF